MSLIAQAPSPGVQIDKEFFSGNTGANDTLDKITGYDIGTTTTDGIFVIISGVLKNIYYLSAVVLFIFIVVGGVGMIINAGNTEKQKQSSKTVSSAVTGFVVLFSSYWIIKLLELITGIKILSL